MSRAEQRNDYWARTLGWDRCVGFAMAFNWLDFSPNCTVTSSTTFIHHYSVNKALFARYVQDYQRRHGGLTVDGILGPNTLNAMINDPSNALSAESRGRLCSAIRSAGGVCTYGEAHSAGSGSSHSAPSNDSRCVAKGGRCLNYAVTNCKNGRVERGLCAGPDHRRCCIPSKDNNKKGAKGSAAWLPVLLGIFGAGAYVVMKK